MYQDVLVPTDGSDGTRRPIAHALTIAERFDATVHALSVIPEGPLGTLEETDATTTTADRAVEHVAEAAEREGLDVTTAIERGVPHEAILDYVAANGIDMVVMGTQGRTGLDRVLVGSVAERVVRLADVPVVTVRRTDELRIDDAEEAVALAREHAETEGYADVSLAADPYRTSGLWTVSFETASEPVTVRVDALTADARLTVSDRV